MQIRFNLIMVLGALALTGAACSSSDGGTDGNGGALSCDVGDAVPCACPSGVQGTQQCLDTGAFTACDCGGGATTSPLPGTTDPAGTDPGPDPVVPPPDPVVPPPDPVVPPPDPVVPPPDPVVPPPDPVIPPPDPGDPFDAARQACVDKINSLRATLGLPPLARWTEGEACADQESQLDGDANDPHGSFGLCSENAQNTCLFRSSTAIDGCLDGMWAEGEPPVPRDQCSGQCYLDYGHYIAMSSTRYTKVACGFYESGGRYWALQNFQ